MTSVERVRRVALVREAQRLIRLERHYHCGGCGHDYCSWSRLRSCPDCDRRFEVAVIRRAALASAGR
jgi:hypothetical protein